MAKLAVTLEGKGESGTGLFELVDAVELDAPFSGSNLHITSFLLILLINFKIGVVELDGEAVFAAVVDAVGLNDIGDCGLSCILDLFDFIVLAVDGEASPV